MPESPVLFVSLGTSPAVVPEAFLFPGVSFQAVHVLTTEKPDIALIKTWFSSRDPAVQLTITRVDGFGDFHSEKDHFHFEEVLYRWILASGTPAASRWICLSGGFKTMSAAMQKAAAVLGAAEVFHVLCDLPPKEQPYTLEAIDSAHRNGKLHWIRLGRESGWPQLSNELKASFPLVLQKEVDGVQWVSAPDQNFRQRLSEIVERSHRIADSWDGLNDLPLTELATWPKAGLDWLRQPLDPSTSADQAWIASLPKIELHCHLGGFATHGAELAAVRSAASQPERLPAPVRRETPEGWPLPSKPIPLDDYMRLGDNNGRHLLRDPDCLRVQCERLYAHLFDQHVVYAEIRCSPANYADQNRQRSALDVLRDIRETFQRCMEEAPTECRCHVNLIIIATRKDGGDRSDISRHLALAITAADEWREEGSCRVVGVDLAGFEDRDTRAALFQADFDAVHRVGLAVTAHAGENDDAEGIWQAVFKLSARRLGHALHLEQSPDLLRAVADRSIGVEMCPYANVQIKGYTPFTGVDRKYPLLDYLRGGICVTVNTDNIGISAASLTDNLLLAARLCPEVTRLDILRLQRNALDAAFVPTSHRQKLLGHISRRLPHP